MNRTHWFLLALVAVLAGYTMYAALLLPRELTVSASIAQAGRRYPILTFMLGFSLGLFAAHLYWEE